MVKKELVFCCIIALLIIGGAFFLSHYYNPEPFNDMGRTVLKPDKVIAGVEHGSRYAREIKLIVVSCVFLLIGFISWVFFRKIKKDNQADLTANEEREPTSVRDWTIALLVISAGLFLPVLIAVFFGFSHFW